MHSNDKYQNDKLSLMGILINISNLSLLLLIDLLMVMISLGVLLEVLRCLLMM
jgi:hypothetical protein